MHMFGNKNKIKKRTIKNASSSAVVSAKKNKTGRGGRRIFSKILIAFFVLAFFGITVYIIFFSPFLLVTKISINGNQDLSANAIGSAVSSEISGKYLNALAKNNIMLISEERIKNIIQDKFKRIKDVQIRKIFPETLQISVVERESMFILCSNNNCFIIDDDGVPYARADFESNELRENELLVLNDDGNKEIKIGENVVAPDFMQYLLDIKNKLKNELNLEIDRNYRTPRLVSGDIRVTTSEGWMIYFDKNLSVEKEIETLKLVLEKIENSENEKRANLEYIDLRIENKVYYKLKTVAEKQP